MKHVAILIETSREYGRGLLRGIARYNREHGNWLTYFEPQGLGDVPPRWLKTWKGDGILARIDNLPTAAVLRAKEVPIVNLRGVLSVLEFPFIGSDNKAVGRLAANHFLERGFKHMGFCGFGEQAHPGLMKRGECFRDFLETRNCTCEILNVAGGLGKSNWERQQKQISRWIEQLPKPVGVMTANDDIGLQVLDACRRVNVSVPDEVAVLGVDNDEYLCEMSIPPLSSIDINSDETGYLAAALLADMMKGKKPPARMPLVKPGGIVVRRSTDVLATSDQEVIKAAQFIRAHACRQIKVTDVLQHAAVSRSSLAPRFKRVLGQTMHQYMLQVQLDHALKLLLETNYPIKRIAHDTGFKSVHYFTRVFSAAKGESPAALRRTRQRSL